MLQMSGWLRTWRARTEWTLVALAAVGMAAAAVYAALTGWTPRDQRAVGAELAARSEFRNLDVRLIPDTVPIAVNAMSTWTIRVRDANGQPVSGAQVEFDGRMPAHGHGLPTAPRVTGEPSPGEYRLEGVRFSMPGDWVLRVIVTNERGSDTLVYALHL